MIEVLEYTFMRHALLTSILVSIACGIMGTYVVVRKTVFVSGGISHAAFGGIGLGYYLGLNPIMVAIPFSVGAALGIGILSKKLNLHEDAAIGVLWTVGMALGVLFIHQSPGYAPDLFSYLFGSILTVPIDDLIMMCGLDCIIVVTVILFYREFLAISFDEEFARVAGVPAGWLYLVMMCLVGLSVVVLIRAVGVILVIALLTIPAVISRNFTSHIKSMMLLSICIGGSSTVGGLFISYAGDLPSGATIVLLLALLLLISTGIKKFL
ncbi:MAG: metal ABC transporter permease [Theionarchaea archaeon]|nr:metal ABC transporter permease [Theionarchaea archaeon]